MRTGETVPIIPRSALFGNPSRSSCEISPDGQWLSWLAPKDGVSNIWLAPVADPGAAEAITDDRGRGVRMYGWLPDGKRLFYIQDEGGTEDWHIFALELGTRAVRDLTPIPGIVAMFFGTSLDCPELIAVGLNDRNPAWHDLYHIDVITGERRLVLENTDEYAGFTLDQQLRPRLASKTAEGTDDHVLYRLDRGAPEIFQTIAPEDEMTEASLGFTRDGGTLYRISAADRDKAALIAIDWESGEEHLLAVHPVVDITGMSSIVDPQTAVIEAVAVEHLDSEWLTLNAQIEADLEHLREALSCGVRHVSRSLDNRRWVVGTASGNRPGRYALYDRATGTVEPLFETRPELAAYPLAPLHPQTVRARDGLELTSYLTLPADETGPRPAAPLPMVLLVHGGPWSRDYPWFNPVEQWLANRGYAVLRVNFRGSSGFGKAMLNAGDREWGARMQDDLSDAVDWAVAEGIADKERVGIMGGSYGGYATLAGLAFTPETFRCGVDIVGPANLETLLATIPPYWQSRFEVFARRIGDPRTEEGRALLKARSPLTKAGDIQKPLLIAQGANDPRVKQAESDQIVAAMREKGLPVTYVLFPEEGHGLVMPENHIAFRAIAEAFLAEHLGGRVEPIGEDFEGARFDVPEGAEHIGGLEAALYARTGKPETAASD